MGNSSSKQGKENGKDSLARYNNRRNDSNINTHKQTIISPHAGIVPHPFQINNGGRYHDEHSSSDEESYVEPAELFGQENVPNHYETDSLCYRQETKQGRPSMMSMGSLAYSESTASAASRSRSIVPHSHGLNHEGSESGTSNVLPLVEPKKKGFFRKRSKHKDVKKEVPHEETLAYKMEQYYYGNGNGNGNGNDDGIGNSDGSRKGPHSQSQNTASARESERATRSRQSRNSSSTMHDVSVLFGSKLPTIADVSYQSSAASYNEEENVQGMSNILGDLVEDDYEEEGGGERGDEGSMVSKEYTVRTEEMVDLPNSYSATKNVENLTSVVDNVERMNSMLDRQQDKMNSMLDRQHASYVEGQEPLVDISMPMQNLGNLFANVNLTMNDTTNNSRYQTLDESCSSDAIQETALDRTDLAGETRFFDESINVFRDNENETHDSNLIPTMEDANSDDDDAFDLFVTGRVDSFRENEEESTKGRSEVIETRPSLAVNETNVDFVADGEDDILSESSVDSEYGILSESSVEQSILESVANDYKEVIEESNYGEESLEEVLSESSAEESKFDESLFNASVADSNDILSESSADQSEIEELLHNHDETLMSNVLSENSLEDEDILGCTDMNHLDRTDMSIQEDILDRTDMAVAVETNDTRAEMLSMLESDGQDSENSPTGELFDYNNNDVATTTTAQSNNKITAGERKRSPFPESKVKMPITSALTNMLPALSHNEEEEEEGLIFDKDKAVCQEEKFENDDIQKNKNVIVNKAIQQQSRQVSGSKFKGPDIGTVICCVRNTQDEQERGNDIHPKDAPTTKPSQETTANKERASKTAYSRQVAKNSIFLFSDGDVRREQPLRVSMVDNQRLNILKKQQPREQETEPSPSGIYFNHTEATIKEQLNKMKSKNNNEITSRKTRSSVSISKINAGIQVNSKGTRTVSIAHKPAASIMDLPAQFNESLKIGSPDTLNTSGLKRTIQLENTPEIGSSQKKPTLGGFKRTSDDAMDADVVHSSSKRNRLDAHITATQGSDKRSSEIKSQSDVVSRNTFESDDISLTELQIRQSAMTPMKNPKSPYIRFKRSVRMFETQRAETEPVKSNEPRKTPPRKNAAAGKGFLFEKGVTSIDGRLRQYRPISAKKQRRLTSGLESIAPRKPTLAHPLFKKQPRDTAIDESVDDDVADFRSLDSSILEEKYNGRQRDSPYEKADEFVLSPSSHISERSPYSATGSEDDFAGSTKPVPAAETSMMSATSDIVDQMLDDVSIESPSPSQGSSIAGEEPLGLRSAMKRKGETNINNRVSWFAKAEEKTESPKSANPKLNRNLDRNFATNPNDNDSTASRTPPRPSSAKLAPAALRVSGFEVYSPARESLASHSPLFISQNVKAPVNPNAMNTHSSVDASHAEDSQASFSPILNYRDGATVTPAKRGGVTNQLELSLSPGPGRRTPSQNRKWTGTSKTPTKNWRDLGAELKKKKKSDKKKKKNRLSGGPLKLLNR